MEHDEVEILTVPEMQAEKPENPKNKETEGKQKKRIFRPTYCQNTIYLVSRYNNPLFWCANLAKAKKLCLAEMNKAMRNPDVEYFISEESNNKFVLFSWQKFLFTKYEAEEAIFYIDKISKK